MHRHPLLAATALAAAASLTACSSPSDLVVSEARADSPVDLAASGVGAECAKPRHCTPALTIGTYVVACRGQVMLAAGAPFVPMNILGTVSADAKGVFTGLTDVTMGGQHFAQKVTGTEALNADCTGTITYATQNQGPDGWSTGLPIDISFVVSAEGERIDGLVTDAGTGVACELFRQHAP